jgi:hypothetical protein
MFFLKYFSLVRLNIYMQKNALKNTSFPIFLNCYKYQLTERLDSRSYRVIGLGKYIKKQKHRRCSHELSWCACAPKQQAPSYFIIRLPSLWSQLRLPVVGTLKRYSKALEYEYRVKTAALGTLKRYSILSLTLYLEWYCAYSILYSDGPH